MAFHTICISHTDGSGAKDLGRVVAERLAYRYVNEQIIEEAAKIAQVDPKIVAATEKKQTLLERILDKVSAAQEVIRPGARDSAAEARAVDRDEVRDMIRAAIEEVARVGKAVIVAHAASFALSGKPGVLRVFVTASDKTRSRRLARELGLPIGNAESVLRDGDKGRRAYLRSFYDIEEELPSHYDMVLNTERLTADQVAAQIVLAATT